MDHWKKEMDLLFHLLDQEVAGYQVLLEDMRKEWDLLKKDDPSNLSALLQSKTVHIDQIKKAGEVVDEFLSTLLINSPPLSQRRLPDLVPHLSLSQANRIKSYQQKMSGLRNEIIRANQKNKYFIQEVLDYLKGLFAILIFPIPEGPVYVKDGRKISPPLPASWMSRKV